MTRLGLVAVAFATACSHNAAPVNVPQLPDDKPVESKIEAPPPPPAPPPEPTPPAKVKHVAIIATPPATMKVISKGKGKPAKLIATRTSHDPIATSLDLVMGFSVKQNGRDQILPEIVLHTHATNEPDKIPDVSSAIYTLEVTSAEIHDVTGETRPPKIEEMIAPLSGMSILGTVHGDGTLGDLEIVHPAATEATIKTIETLVKPGLVPMWPVLPPDAIAPGAKWQVTTPLKIADKLDVVETVDYELVAATDKGWEIRGTITLVGPDQTLDGQPVVQVGGQGTFTSTSTGRLFNPMHEDLVTRFTVKLPADKGGDQQLELHFSNDLSVPKS